MTIPEKLSQLLRLSNQARVARAAGISPRTLSNYLASKTNPTIPIVKRLAEVLEVEPGWLLDDTQGWPPVRTEGLVQSAA